MEIVERVGVAALTAKKLFEEGSPGQLAVALTLLEGAAEGAMRRRADQWEAGTLYADFFRRHREVDDITLPAATAVSHLSGRTWQLTKKTQRAVEKTFEGLVDYLVFLEAIPESYKRPLLRLHEYRNAAYHRNQVRHETLRSSVRLYLFLVSDLLDRLTPNMYRLYTPAEAEAFASVLGITASEASNARVTQPALAATLRDFGDDPTSVAETLSVNAFQRLDEVEESLGFIAHVLNDRGLDAEDASRLVQWTGDPRISATELQGKQFPVTLATKTQWRGVASKISEANSDLAAFTLFAEFEGAFEAYEDAVNEMAIQADQHVQQQIDERRGK